MDQAYTIQALPANLPPFEEIEDEVVETTVVITVDEGQTAIDPSLNLEALHMIVNEELAKEGASIVGTTLEGPTYVSPTNS